MGKAEKKYKTCNKKITKKENGTTHVKHKSLPRIEITDKDRRYIKNEVAKYIELFLYCGYKPIGIRMWDAHVIVFNYSQLSNLEYKVANELFKLFTKKYTREKYGKICKKIFLDKGQEVLDAIFNKILSEYIHESTGKYRFVQDIVSHFGISEIYYRIIRSVKFEEYNKIPKKIEYEDRKYIKTIVDFTTNSIDISEEKYESIAMYLKKSLNLVKEWIKGYHQYEKERREDNEHLN